METVSKTNTLKTQSKSEILQENPFFNALKFGMKGFITFFVMFFLVTSIAYITGISETFDIGIREVISSISGFLLLFLIKIMETKRKAQD